jgi:hypothetical protein
MLDLCKEKQKVGEPFITFLQRWRRLFARYSRPIPEKEKMDIFINSLDQELSYRLNLHCCPHFEKLIENTITIEGALVKRRVIKFDKDNPSSSNHNINDKTRFWNRNKNIVNDGIVDANNLRTRPFVFNLSSAPCTNQQGKKNQQGQNSNQESMTKKTNTDNHGNFNTNLGNAQT